MGHPKNPVKIQFKRGTKNWIWLTSCCWAGNHRVGIDGPNGQWGSSGVDTVSKMMFRQGQWPTGHMPPWTGKTGNSWSCGTIGRPGRGAPPNSPWLLLIISVQGRLQGTCFFGLAAADSSCLQSPSSRIFCHSGSSATLWSTIPSDALMRATSPFGGSYLECRWYLRAYEQIVHNENKTYLHAIVWSRFLEHPPTSPWLPCCHFACHTYDLVSCVGMAQLTCEECQLSASWSQSLGQEGLHWVAS